jgi:small redox-active disulfide protein 2
MTMQIKILGPGCPSCQRLFETTREVVDDLGLDARVEIGHDIAEMISYGVMGSPLLIVDDEVAMAGRVLPKRRMKEFLTHLIDARDEERHGN